jgi:regulator of replication initiation timing
MIDREPSQIIPRQAGSKTLQKLYDEGFHVCNTHYAHLRTEGECLFCVTFLQL